MSLLPEPEVMRCYFDTGFSPPVAAMELRWPASLGDNDRSTWRLPDEITLIGRAPKRFGLHIRREDDDAYAVCLLWNWTSLRWHSLTRADIEESALGSILGSMGTKLNYLLDQPIFPTEAPVADAA